MPGPHKMHEKGVSKYKSCRFLFGVCYKLDTKTGVKGTERTTMNQEGAKRDKKMDQKGFKKDRKGPKKY